MGEVTDLYQLPYPIGSDSPNVPRDIKALAEKVDELLLQQTMPVFPSVTERDEAIPEPVENQMCLTAGWMQIRRAAVWATLNASVSRTDTETVSVSTRYWSKYPMGGSITVTGLGSEMWQESADGYGIKVGATGVYMATGSVTVDSVSAGQVVGVAMAYSIPGESGGIMPFPTAISSPITLPCRPAYIGVAAGFEIFPWVYLNNVPANVKMKMQLQYLGG